MGTHSGSSTIPNVLPLGGSLLVCYIYLRIQCKYQTRENFADSFCWSKMGNFTISKAVQKLHACVHNFQCETIFIRPISLSKWRVIPISLWRSPNRLAQFHVPPKIAQLSAHKCRQQNTSVLKPGGPGTFQRSSLPNFSCLWRQDASQNQTIRSTLKDYYVVPRLVHLG